MFECCYSHETIMRMEREELNSKLDRMARHNHYPAGFSRKKKDLGKLSLFMVFFRNVMMK